MPPTGKGRIAARAAIFCLGAAMPLLGGCGSTQGNIALGAVGTTLLGANSPSHEIEQTYYLGVFDPMEQLPPLIYRVRVQGQASFISRMRFGSGWVRAELIDSLSSGPTLNDKDGSISFTKDNDELARLAPGRRLIVYGPEGFREAPKNHRLVLVMGSNPEGYFEAMDTVLGTYANAAATMQESGLNKILLQQESLIKDEKLRVAQSRTRLERDLPAPAKETTQ